MFYEISQGDKGQTKRRKQMQAQPKADETKYSSHYLNGTKLTREMYGEYYPLGQYIVAAPGVCGGRPTFKYTRLEVSVILALLTTGRTIEQLVQAYSLSHLTLGAVKEAIRLADLALLQLTLTHIPLTA
jgi:uncharacterized protein (DUF433 family)